MLISLPSKNKRIHDIRDEQEVEKFQFCLIYARNDFLISRAVKWRNETWIINSDSTFETVFHHRIEISISLI